MGSSGWRTQITFLLAGAIFVLCQIIVSGSRGTINGPELSQAGDRGVQDGGSWRAPADAGRFETEGRGD